MPAAFQARSMSRYSVILFCRFFAASKLSGLMFSSPMKMRVIPARFALATKFGILWHIVSTWMRKRTSMPSCSRSLMMTVEDRLPVLVAREIAISDEEPVDAVLVVLAQDALDIVGAAAAGF